MLSHDIQYHIQLRPGDVGRYCIIPGDPGRCEKIAAYLDNPREIACNREYCTWVGTLSGEQVAVTSSGIGGPSLAIAVEELARLGVDTFIRVGTCGGMQKQILPGDLVIASGAIRMEGTSREYLPIEYPAVADVDTIIALRDACKRLSFACHVGVASSKDSFYGQQEPATMPVSYALQNKWDAWIKGGALCSEMECAALFTVAAVRRLRAGAVLSVIHNQVRREMSLIEKPVHDHSRAIQAAVEALRLLTERDRETA